MITCRAHALGFRLPVVTLVVFCLTSPASFAAPRQLAGPGGSTTTTSVPVAVDPAPNPDATLFPERQTGQAPVGVFDEADVPLPVEEGPGPELPAVPLAANADVPEQPVAAVLGADPASTPPPTEVPVGQPSAPSGPQPLPPDVLPPDISPPTSDTTPPTSDTTPPTSDTTPPTSDTSPPTSDTSPSTSLAIQPVAYRADVPRPGRRHLRYVVIPHPDDEFEAWSLVQHAPDHYAVFLLMTRGEASGYCGGGGILNTDTGDQTIFGERLPQPQPFTGKNTNNCKAQRIDAFDASFDALGAIDGSLGSPRYVGRFVMPARRGQFSPTRVENGQTVAANYFDAWIGPLSARLVFDLGDGQLTAQKVTWAIQSVRRMRSRLPVHAEDDIIGSAYYNPGFAGSVPYSHPDHYAVQQALFETDQGTPGPQWGRTVPGDPNRRRRAFVDSATYCAVMCTDPLPIDPYANLTAARTGAYQRVYGWLAFCSIPGRPATNTFWPASFEPSESVFSQAQDFWRRFGDQGRAARFEQRAGGVQGLGSGLRLWLMVLAGLAALLVALRRRRRTVQDFGRG